VYVEGSLQTKKYTDKDGVEKYATQIKGHSMQMLGGRQSAEGEQPERQTEKPAPKQSVMADLDDDIPF